MKLFDFDHYPSVSETSARDALLEGDLSIARGASDRSVASILAGYGGRLSDRLQIQWQAAHPRTESPIERARTIVLQSKGSRYKDANSILRANYHPEVANRITVELLKETGKGGSMSFFEFASYGNNVMVGASSVTIQTPTVVTKTDLVGYIGKLQPYVDAMDSDIKNKTYNVSSEPVAKTISIVREDGATDERISNEVGLVKTWRGWGFMDSSGNPENPGYLRTWQKTRDQAESGIITTIYPWYVFIPGGIFVAPYIYAASIGGAERRRDQWNSIRDAHILLGKLREQLRSLGYEPSGGELPDVPGSVGPLGVGPLGGEGGKGGAKPWYENMPWGWITFGGVAFAAAVLLAQLRGIFK